MDGESPVSTYVQKTSMHAPAMSSLPLHQYVTVNSTMKIVMVNYQNDPEMTEAIFVFVCFGVWLVFVSAWFYKKRLL